MKVSEEFVFHWISASFPGEIRSMIAPVSGFCFVCLKSLSLIRTFQQMHNSFRCISVTLSLAL